MQFPTFAECWKGNPAAHMFPDGCRMKKGMYKTCFIGMLGVAEDDLPRITQDIQRYNSNLRTKDIVTCMELGVRHTQTLFQIKEGQETTVLIDVLRPALINKRAVVGRCAEEKYQVLMINVREKHIRMVTRGSHVRVTNNTSTLYGQVGIAQRDGDLDGWSCVEIKSVLYTIPTIWLATDSAEAPLDRDWESRAILSVLAEHLVPKHDPNTSIKFAGDGAFGNAGDTGLGLVQNFDPDNTVTPKIFATFETNMRDWSQQAQKDAIVDSICELHVNNPARYFEKERIVGGMCVHFNWEGCSGTQSILETKQEDLFYVDNSSPEIRAQAFIGRYSRARAEMQWENGEDRQFVRLQRIEERDEDLMVLHSRVSSRFDHTRTGRLSHRSASVTMCTVEWDQTTDGLSGALITSEKLEDLERSVFIQKVVMPPGLVCGTVDQFSVDMPSTYVHVTFQRGTTISDDMGGAWFHRKQLDESRFRHRLHIFLSYPWRTVRFTVQERVGVSIKCIAVGQSILIINTVSAMRNFRQAIAFFCAGAARMVHENITHNDLHCGNLTISQTSDGESFAVKMIDFERMQKHRRFKTTDAFKKEFLWILQALDLLVEHVKCVSQYPSVRRNHDSAVKALRQYFHGLRNMVLTPPTWFKHSEHPTEILLVEMVHDVVHIK